MKFWALFLAILVGVVVSPFAQSVEVMDGIVSTQEITVAQASYLSLVASGRLPETATLKDAFEASSVLGWVKGSGDAQRSSTVSEFAFLVARSFNLPGGFLEALVPGPRYAYRDLVAQGYFPTNEDPGAPLSGANAIRILETVMEALPEGPR